MMCKRLASYVLVVAVFLAMPCVMPAEEVRRTRPIRVDDLFQAEQLGTPQFSPDGQALAFTRERSALSQPSNGLLTSNTRSDVWLEPMPGESALNLTKGATDSSGWWDPRWSPDGRALAFLSSRGGNVNAWVWERSTQRVRQVTNYGVEFDGPSGGCRWVGSRQMLCLGVGDGKQATPTTREGRGAERARAAWKKAEQSQLTVSEVDSREFRPETHRLILSDLDGGETKVVAPVAYEYEKHGETWWLSTDARTVALAPPVPSAYPASYRARMGWPSRLSIKTLDGRPLRLDKELPDNVLTTTLAWSPNGQELAFFAFGDSKVNPILLYGEEAAKDIQHEPTSSFENPARLWRVNVDTGRVDKWDTGAIDLGHTLRPPSFSWLRTGSLLFGAKPRSGSVTADSATSLKWLVLDRDGQARQLSVDSHQGGLSPEVSFTQGASIGSVNGGRLELSKGELWLCDPVRGRINNLTAAFAPDVHRLLIDSNESETSVVLLRAGDPGDTLSQWGITYLPDWPARGVTDYILDLRTNNVVQIGRPDPSAVPVAFHARTRTVAYVLDDARGTSLWRYVGAHQAKRVIETNTFYKDIIRGEERTIEYVSQNGEMLKAKLTLPANYVPGRRYPLVVDSDIGYTFENTTHLFVAMPTFPPTHPSVFTAEVFAAAGYIYMFASMPTMTGMDEVGRGNLLLFTNGLLPAIEKATSMGLADPERVFLYGESSFGFGALGVITQTSRFKAAVSSNGWVDQVTASLSVDYGQRYSANPFNLVLQGAYYSSSRLPFWRNGDHYRRNSPLAYVDRVRTPLMLIACDFDKFPMSEAEMFFSALVIQRKAARLVRYWGEGHGLSTPVNFRDSFQRIFAWYDEHGDIARDQAGLMIFNPDGRVRPRNGQRILRADDFGRFGPAAPVSEHSALARRRSVPTETGGLRHGRVVVRQ